MAVVGELVVLRPQHDADRRVGGRPEVRSAARPRRSRRRLQFVAGLQRARIGAAEAGAGIDGEAAEHRLARNAAFDREVAERAAAGKTQRQRLAIGQRHRRIECHRASGDVGVARARRQARRAPRRRAP